ncbi:hypothetical protein [Micromonospora sp. WMMD710]|uniref:hypothetical protein n=1 Tax=Micromonospora sp. WMMD710 TaxID=3016085 RepID=UPI002416B7CB|nr:hypothetical protein [Micromonospora sp. WMMD710]MDG4759404.1 hypothetical protein [Micromonospora sp. WMMD710]
MGAGRPICKACRPRPPRTCFRCGRSRPVQAEWPAGPVCVGCYENVRRHPAECFNCRQVRPLIARNDEGGSVCGPCVGVDLTYTCRGCGRSGEIHCDERCFHCVLAERLTDLLTGPDGQVAEQLRPLQEALTGVDNPATVVGWLAKSRSAKLLREFAITPTPLTHNLLDQQPQTQPLHYIREVLVTTGVLPPREEHLERLGPWLDRILAGKPSHHVRAVKPFAQWFVIRRARRSATRNGDYRRSSADHARARILNALELLSWLDQHELTLETLTQPVLDRWLEKGATTRRSVRYFLAWAHNRGLVTGLDVPMAAKTAPAILLKEDDRVAQLRRCFTDEALPLDLRVAGVLILLFALPLTRVLRLRDADVLRDPDHTHLLIDGHQLRLPARLADLIHRLQTHAGA